MSHRDQKTDPEIAPNSAESELPVAPQPAGLVPGEQSFQADLEAGPLLAELLASGATSDVGGDDFHAAIASLGEEAFEDLDSATQYLTHSVDLFDVPVCDDAA